MSLNLAGLNNRVKQKAAELALADGDPRVLRGNAHTRVKNGEVVLGLESGEMAIMSEDLAATYLRQAWRCLGMSGEIPLYHKTQKPSGSKSKLTRAERKAKQRQRAAPDRKASQDMGCGKIYSRTYQPNQGSTF